MTRTARIFRMQPGALAAFLLGAVAACAGEPPAQSGERAADRALPADGIEVVGTAEAIAHIADIAEADDGTLWILNDAEPWFIAMSPDGEVLRSWGRTGGGPNEFRNPTTLIRDAASGSIFAYDAGRCAKILNRSQHRLVSRLLNQNFLTRFDQRRHCEVVSESCSSGCHDRLSGDSIT
jgi:hypothetical protein